MNTFKQNTNSAKQLEYFFDRHIIVISTQPDDEILGAGTLLALVREPAFLHTTARASKDREDSIYVWYLNLKEYYEVRRAEFRSAPIK